MQLAVLGGSQLLGGALFKTAILGASIAGSMLLNGKKKPVGKLNDVRVSSATYGRGIPYVWGTMRVTGNMFWATEFREEKKYITQKGKEKTGGKGEKKAKKGKAEPVYTYYANFAMGLCAGAMDDVLRIWADNNLIYNKLNPDDPDIVGPGFSRREAESTGKRTQKNAGGKKGRGGTSGRFAWRFYPGDDQQLPDPFMESVEGAGNVPAYRDLCYLMFQDFALEDFGNRVPTITAEVVSSVDRKPQVLTFTNIEPEIEWNALSINRPFFDPTRQNLYLAGEDTDGDRWLRIWDIESRTETKRIRYKDILPQTTPHGQTGDYSNLPLMNTYRTWTEDDIDLFLEYGTTPKGDVVLQRAAGNYGPIIFMDPASNRLIKSWGASGNVFGTPWDGIFVPDGAFPLVVQDEVGEPAPITIVYERFGKMHIFNEFYNKVGEIECAGIREHHCQGGLGSNRAMFFVNGAIGGTGQINIYSAEVIMPLNTPTADSGERLELEEELVASWPEVSGSEGFVSVLDMGFIAGAQCVAVIASAGGNYWALKFDYQTGELLWQKKFDLWDGVGNLYMGGFISPPTYLNTNGWTIEAENMIFKVDFRLEEITVHAGNSDNSSVKYTGARYYWSERDAMLGFVDDDGVIKPTIVYQDRKTQHKVDLAEIVTDIAGEVGISEDRIRTNGIETQEPLIGYMIEQPGAARNFLEELADVFQFDCTESDNQLIFKARGGPPVVDIPEEHLGVVEADIGTDNERIVETIQQELELPERVTVTYYDAKNDYENGSQYFKRPGGPLPVMSTREHLELTFNMSLLSQDAKAMAKRILYAAWSERTTQEFRLPRDYLRLDPGDVVAIDMKDGRRIECRITDITTGANMELEINSVANLAQSYEHVATTDAPRGLVPQNPASTNFAYPLVRDLPYLTDAHEISSNDFGFYWAAGATKPGYNFGILQSKFEDSNWQTEGYAQVDAIWGYVDGIVPPPANGWNMIDDQTVITLRPAFDFNQYEEIYTWESIPDAEWPSTNNLIIINDEIILFKDVVENADGTISISNLVRGHRGTIDAAYRHLYNGEWIIYAENAVQFGREDLTYLNQFQKYIINTGNPLAPFVAARTSQLKGGTERPLPVGDVRRSNETNGDITIEWSRSTRLGGSLKSGTGSVPLNEESEEYVVFLLDGPYDAQAWDPDDTDLYVWKSDILTSSQVTIPQATLSTAGISSSEDITVVIHQMSASVGFGFPRGLTLRYSLIGD
ncbi:MAG: phage tail protein [Hoeflea sp.]|jgi:hypothetical protein|uniref:phage tail protein n=1 Tax=Hoeflea sp. TaxID=1940281 RepID=UPI0032ED5D36